MIKETYLMIEDKCLVLDMPCIGGEIGKKCKDGGEVICPAFNEYFLKKLLGEELYYEGRELLELIENPEDCLAYSLPLILSMRSKYKGKTNDR